MRNINATIFVVVFIITIIVLFRVLMGASGNAKKVTKMTHNMGADSHVLLKAFEYPSYHTWKAGEGGYTKELTHEEKIEQKLDSIIKLLSESTIIHQTK